MSNLPYIFKKNYMIYLFLIASLYLSILLPIISGLGRLVHPTLSFFILLIVQGFIFILPLIVLTLIKLNTVRGLLIISLFIYLVIIQITVEYFDLRDFLFGVKNIFGSLLYIPIVYHLIVNYEQFSFKIEKHIRYIFIITLSILYFELISARISNPLHSFFMLLAENKELLGGRPLGIMLNIHYQGIILGMAAIYYFINKKNILVILIVLGLVLSNIKTWTIALLFVIVYYSLKNMYRLNIKYFLIIVFGILVFMAALLTFFSGVVDHYIGNLSASSSSINLMKSLWFSVFDVALNTFFPVGFFSQSDVSLQYSDLMNYSDAFFVFNIFQVGIVGMIIYLFIMYHTLFRKNKYSYIVLLSLFSIIHTNPLLIPGILIIVVYFGYYYILEDKTIGKI